MTRTQRPRRRGPAIVATVLLIAGLLPLFAEEAEERVEARSYAVRFRPLADAAELVSAVLSEGGEITLQPRLKRLVVKDRVSVLDQIGPLVESFDLPPRTVDVSINLAVGRESEAGRHVSADGPYREDRGVFETVPPITKWTAYDPLGKRAVIGVEGATVTTDFADDYRVVFEVESVEDDIVTFKRLWLQRVVTGPEGEQSVQNLYSAKVVIESGKTLMVGAAQAPNSKKALFISLKANPR